jgi:HlyD family secretion protein
MKTLLKKILLALILIVVPLGIFLAWSAHSRRQSTGEAYLTSPVEWGTMSELVGATGLVQPVDALVASSPLSGQVVEIYPGAEINRTVQEGDPLLRLDDRLARKKMAQAEAAVRLAQADVARAEAARNLAQIEFLHASELRQQDLASHWTTELAEGQIRAAEAAVAAARAKVAEAQTVREQAELGVELSVVRVPTVSNGTAAKRSYLILERKVVLGQLVAPPESAQLFTLVGDISAMRVHAQVGEDDIGKVYPGLPATFTIHSDSDEEHTFDGRVAEIRPVPTRLHGAVFYDAILDVANRRHPTTKEWLLRPGMTVSANIVRRTHSNIWKLPAAALDIEPLKQDLTDAARAKLASGSELTPAQHWRTIWISDAANKPWPIFVRIGGVNAAGDKGIADGQYVEVMEWDPELKPKPDPKVQATYPRMIIGKPPSKSSGLFDQPSLKIF